jgi:hypothetical protein
MILIHKEILMLNARSLALCGCILSVSAHAGVMGHRIQTTDVNPRPWLAVASMGYTLIENTGPGTGQTALGRFAIGKNLYEFGERDTFGNAFHASLMNFGFEFGVQNGARLSLEETAVQSTLRPMLDFLGTLTLSPLESQPFFLSAKLGLAYRQWQMDYTTINNLSQITGELQAGGGMPIGDAAAISILYQGIYGSNPKLITYANTNSAHVSNIPQQNGVLVSLSLLL